MQIYTIGKSTNSIISIDLSLYTRKAHYLAAAVIQAFSVRLSPGDVNDVINIYVHVEIDICMWRESRP